MDAVAELRWLKVELEAQREIAEHHSAAARNHETTAAARDTFYRQQLRRLGLWRLMGKLGRAYQQGNHCHITGGSMPHFRGVTATCTGGHSQIAAGSLPQQGEHCHINRPEPHIPFPAGT